MSSVHLMSVVIYNDDFGDNCSNDNKQIHCAQTYPGSPGKPGVPTGPLKAPFSPTNPSRPFNPGSPSLPGDPGSPKNSKGFSCLMPKSENFKYSAVRYVQKCIYTV